MTCNICHIIENDEYVCILKVYSCPKISGHWSHTMALY